MPTAMAVVIENEVAAGAVVGLLSMAVFLALLPAITVTHIDAFAYIEGARSLARGKGYVAIDGEALNHWPPGYSWLLSFFADPLVASYWINAISLAVTITYIVRLAVRAGWPTPVAMAFAATLGFGFLASLASSAMPEILTYAVFFVAIFTIVDGRPMPRRIAFVALALLPPLKSIAVVFLPAIFLAELWLSGLRDHARRIIDYLPAGATLAVVVGGLMYFNSMTIGAPVSSSHARPDLAQLVGEALRFPHDVIRSFLANWYGSLRSPLYLAIFTGVVAAGVLAYASLRFSARGLVLRRLGLVLFTLSCALEFVRIFYATPRLLGYGMLLFILGCAPEPRGVWRWSAYAGATLVSAVLAAGLVDRAGSSAIPYRTLSAAIAPSLPTDRPVYSNSYRILDIHLGRHAVSIREWPTATERACVLHILLPNLDAVGSSVWPLPPPPAAWIMTAEVGAAKLWCTR